MTYRISKSFTFAASHQLFGLPPEHKCARLHGHNYEVELEMAASQLDEVGFVVDYAEMDLFKKLLDDCFDHRHLNDVMTNNPTAEHLAELLFTRGSRLLNVADRVVTAVKVRETPKTCAEYRP